MRNRVVEGLRGTIIAWWLLWLIVAVSVYGGLSSKVILLVVFSLCGFAIGSTRSLQRPISHHTQQRERGGSARIAIIVLSAIILYQIPLCLRSVGLLPSLGASFRGVYFEDPSQGPFGSGILFVAYDQFMIPTGMYMFAFWVCLKKKGTWWFIYATMFFLLDATISAGRFPLYFYVFFLAIGHTLGTFRLRLYLFIPMLAGLSAYGFWLLFARGSIVGWFGTDTAWDILEKTVLKYHIGGFYLLQDLMSKRNLQTDTLFPYYTLGYFQYLMSLLLRPFGIGIVYPLQNLNYALTDPRYLPEIGMFNAFSTTILPLYLDGGFLFSFFTFFVYGYAVRYGSTDELQPLSPLGVMTAFIMIFGLFQPLAITGLYYLPVMIYFGTRLFNPPRTYSTL